MKQVRFKITVHIMTDWPQAFQEVPGSLKLGMAAVSENKVLL